MYSIEKYKETKRILWIILFANFTVAAIKIIMGGIIGSSSMSADGFHSLTDGSSNIVGLIAIGIASKPKDKEHPYGHSKYETLASLLIGIMLCILGIRVILEAISKLVKPTDVSVSLESIIALLFTLLVNIYVSIFEYRKGTLLKSEILVSDSIHTKGDIFISTGVLIAIVSIKLGTPIIIDPLVSFAVSAFIFKAAYEILSVSSGILVDKAAVDSRKIQEIVMKQEGVFGVHNIRSRGNSDEVFIDMHIVLNPRFNVSQTHELSHKIENTICENLNNKAQVILHIEPFEGG